MAKKKTASSKPQYKPMIPEEAKKLWASVGFNQKPSYEEMVAYLTPYLNSVELIPDNEKLFSYSATIGDLSRGLGVKYNEIEETIRKQWLEQSVHPYEISVMETQESYEAWNWIYSKKEHLPTKKALERGYIKMSYNADSSWVAKYLTEKGIEKIKSWYQSIQLPKRDTTLQLSQFIPFKDGRIDYRIAEQVIYKLYEIPQRSRSKISEKLTLNKILIEHNLLYRAPNGGLKVTDYASECGLLYGEPVTSPDDQDTKKIHQEYKKYFTPSGIAKVEEILNHLNYHITTFGIYTLKQAVEINKTLMNYDINLDKFLAPQPIVEQPINKSDENTPHIPDEPPECIPEFTDYVTGLQMAEDDITNMIADTDVEYTISLNLLDEKVKKLGWLEIPEGSTNEGYVVSQKAREAGYMKDEYVEDTPLSTVYRRYLTRAGIEHLIAEVTAEALRDKLDQEPSSPTTIQKVYGDTLNTMDSSHVVYIAILPSSPPLQYLPHFGSVKGIPEGWLSKPLRSISISQFGDTPIIIGKEL